MMMDKISVSLLLAKFNYSVVNSIGFNVHRLALLSLLAHAAALWPVLQQGRKRTFPTPFLPCYVTSRNKLVNESLDCN